jgi:hypothetical protein
MLLTHAMAPSSIHLVEAVFKLEPDRRTEAVARRLTNLGYALGATR